MKISFSSAKAATVDCDVLAVFVSDAWKEELADMDARMDGALIRWLEAEEFDTSPRSAPTRGSARWPTGGPLPTSAGQ